MGNEISLSRKNIIADGDLADWQAIPMRFFQEEKLALGIAWDGENLAILIKGDWETHRRNLLFGGLNLRIEHARQLYSFQYRPDKNLLRSMPGHKRAAGDMPSFSPLEYFALCELLYTEDEMTVILPMHNAFAVSGGNDYEYWLELTIPLEMTERRGLFRKRSPKIDFSLELGGNSIRPGGQTDDTYSGTGRRGGGKGTGRPDDMMSRPAGSGKRDASSRRAEVISIRESFTFINK